MKTLTSTLACLAVSLLAVGASAQETMKRDDTGKNIINGQLMTPESCKAHMAMSAKATSKDDAMMKKDAVCMEMLKKDGGGTGAMQGDAMKK